jgi:hypothetical protein
MKRLLWFLLVTPIIVGATIRPSDPVTVATRTIYNDGNLGVPDSVDIVVFKDGAVVFASWFNSGDAECSVDSSWLIFTDQLQDIDGSGGNGHYLIIGRAYDFDSTLYTPWVYSFDVGLFEAIDSSMIAAGYHPDYKAFTQYAADRDTVWEINDAGTDTTYMWELFHVGGSAGDPPDSIKGQRW